MAAVYYFLLGLFQLCLAASMVNGRKTVSTMAGDVAGVERMLDGESYRVFAGIPYAEPPVGPLRFSDPVAKSSWVGPALNATSFGRSCPQADADMAVFNPEYVVMVPPGASEIGEDCLTLNVYTPGDVGNATAGGLAVMVWLHGGGYQHGQGSAYDASALSVKGGVVVVTVNYRLGPLGFLFTGDDSATGNYGLKDQQLALKWVKDNIMAFGGDPERVTLFGQSDVFETTTLHLTADESRPLFQRVAVHSPNWQSELGDDPNADSLAGFLNCSSENTSLLVDCLRSRSMEEILDANKKVVEAEKSSYVWLPVSNDDFFTKPAGGIEHQLLSVFNSGDGSIGLDLLQESLHFDGEPYSLAAGVTEEQFEEWLSSYTEDSGVSELAIGEQYVPRDIADEDLARTKALVNIQLDTVSIRYNSERLTKLMKKVSPVFMMVFDHSSSVVGDKYPGELDLVPHGGELAFVFGLPFNASGDGGAFTADEQELSSRLIKFWSNFAKTGDPNSDGTTDPQPTQNQPIWPEYGASKKYLRIGQNEEEVGSDYRGEEAYFWNEYLSELNEAAKELCLMSKATTKPQTSDEIDPRPTGILYDKCDGKVVIGENLGLALSPEQAEGLIGTMVFVGVALLCMIVLVGAVALGFKSKSNGADQKTELNAETGTAPGNHYGPSKQHVNSAVEPDIQESAYENMRAPAVHNIEINHKPDPNDDSEDEAEPLQEKRPIPDSDEDEIPPRYASVDRSRQHREVTAEDHVDAADDEEVNFPPPPDNWAAHSEDRDQGEDGSSKGPDTSIVDSVTVSDGGSASGTDANVESSRM